MAPSAPARSGHGLPFPRPLGLPLMAPSAPARSGHGLAFTRPLARKCPDSACLSGRSVGTSLSFPVMSPTDLLADVDLFADLTPGEIRQLTDASTTEDLRRGDVLFHEGDAPDKMYVAVSGRIAIAKRLIEMAAGSDEFTLPVTQEELAAMVGASRERVNKEIASFVRLGWIEQSERRYRITDREQLERRAR